MCSENIFVLCNLATVKLGLMWRGILTLRQKLLWKLTHCTSGHWREAGRRESIWMCGQSFWSFTKTTKMPQLVLVPTEKAMWPLSLYLAFTQNPGSSLQSEPRKWPQLLVLTLWYIFSAICKMYSTFLCFNTGVACWKNSTAWKSRFHLFNHVWI